MVHNDLSSIAALRYTRRVEGAEATRALFIRLIKAGVGYEVYAAAAQMEYYVDKVYTALKALRFCESTVRQSLHCGRFVSSVIHLTTR